MISSHCSLVKRLLLPMMNCAVTKTFIGRPPSVSIWNRPRIRWSTKLYLILFIFDGYALMALL